MAAFLLFLLGVADVAFLYKYHELGNVLAALVVNIGAVGAILALTKKDSKKLQSQSPLLTDEGDSLTAMRAGRAPWRS